MINNNKTSCIFCGNPEFYIEEQVNHNGVLFGISLICTNCAEPNDNYIVYRGYSNE